MIIIKQDNNSDILMLSLDPETEPELIINPDTREIAVPEELYHIGVVADDNAEMVKIRVPRYFDGNDLSQRICTISFNNAANERGIYLVTQKEINDDSLLLFWHISKFVTKKSGIIKFVVEFKKEVDDRGMSYSWSTIPAALQVMSGLDDNIIIEEKDLTLYQSLVSMIQANERKIYHLSYQLETLYQTNIEVQSIKYQLQLISALIAKLENSIPYFESLTDTQEIVLEDTLCNIDSKQRDMPLLP